MIDREMDKSHSKAYNIVNYVNSIFHHKKSFQGKKKTGLDAKLSATNLTGSRLYKGSHHKSHKSFCHSLNLILVPN